MAKLGRYSADKKKTMEVGADTTLTNNDCGKIIFVTATCTITLPDAAAVGAGWWCKIIKNFGTGNVINIVATSDLNGVGRADSGTIFNNDISFHTDATKGTVLEIISDGTQWFAVGIASSADGFNV